VSINGLGMSHAHIWTFITMEQRENTKTGRNTPSSLGTVTTKGRASCQLILL